MTRYAGIRLHPPTGVSRLISIPALFIAVMLTNGCCVYLIFLNVKFSIAPTVISCDLLWVWLHIHVLAVAGQMTMGPPWVSRSIPGPVKRNSQQLVVPSARHAMQILVMIVMTTAHPLYSKHHEYQ